MRPTRIRDLKMKRTVLNYLVIAALAVVAVLTSCGGGGGIGGSSWKIKMTTDYNDFFVILSGSGVATVDWGDGSEKITLTLPTHFSHTYPNNSIRTITINGDNITKLHSNFITSLDVSRCTELTYIYTEQSRLTSLDVSKNKALTSLGFTTCQFTASALNAMFGTLHSNAGEKTIDLYGTSGAEDCDRSIAERKGWTFR